MKFSMKIMERGEGANWQLTKKCNFSISVVCGLSTVDYINNKSVICISIQ